MSNEWGPPETVEITFEATGRTATLWKDFPAMELAAEGQLPDELIDALEAIGLGELKSEATGSRLIKAICIGAFVRPRVVARREDAVYDEDEERWDAVSFASLERGECLEVLTHVMQSLVDAQKFRGERPGAADGADGEGVGRPAKPSGGTKERKPGGRAGGQSARGKATRAASGAGAGKARAKR